MLGRPSFETRPSGAPQDEVDYFTRSKAGDCASAGCHPRRRAISAVGLVMRLDVADKRLGRKDTRSSGPRR